MKKLYQHFIIKTTRSLPIAMLFAVVTFLGFGSGASDNGVVPFAHADTPHTGGPEGGSCNDCTGADCNCAGCSSSANGGGHGPGDGGGGGDGCGDCGDCGSSGSCGSDGASSGAGGGGGGK